MIRRMRANRAELHSQKEGFRDNIKIKETRITFLKFKKVPDSELIDIKEKIRWKAHLEKKRVLLITIIVTVLFSIGYAYLLFIR
ncbi:hypothetical protein BZG02_02650 [Labilibaculum filiforme]|uniref:Uncharacterized protein n=2 Tax=Labilibaculum filiforme TaxID=1940526 RepID=A0A2N3I6J9_9BACT|nr:hypothetical protein BZG02_02650 [Labilibaculum filiforme]